MTQKATFQSIILKLQNFWAERGAVLWEPYYSQVGAGTMNPATFLRVLGPEPWNVAYVEPSVRSDDATARTQGSRMKRGLFVALFVILYNTIMSIRKDTKNWIALADYDLETARHMLSTGRYLYVIFMCYLSLEKMLKAHVTEVTQSIPVKTHDLSGQEVWLGTSASTA